MVSHQVGQSSHRSARFKFFLVIIGTVSVLMLAHPRPILAAEFLTLTTGDYQVLPGDYFECFYSNITTQQELSVSAVGVQQAKGGHHVSVYYTDTPQPVQHHQCKDEEMVGWYMIGSGAGHDKTPVVTLELPKGLAWKVSAGKQIVFQTHYINSTTLPMTVHDTVRLELMDPKDVTSYVNLFLLHDATFAIPPHAHHRVTATCTVPHDFNLVLLLGHMHSYGTHSKLEQVDASGRSLAVLYEQNDWKPLYAWNPPKLHYSIEHPLQLKAGMRLRQTCEWENPTDETLRFPREMCVGVGVYFPSEGQIFCPVDQRSEQ